MKKLSPKAYKALFFKHVWRFMGQVASVKELAGSHAIGVSGGRDSMALLWFANELHKQGKIGPVRAFFIHHHTRAGQDNDLELVRNFCLENTLELKVLHVMNLNSDRGGNFEARARRARRDLLIQSLKANESLWLGHHLDDSFEWNLMTRHRSTNPRAMLGVPVRNGAIIRPFSCVSRAQVSRLVRYEGIPFRNDPTNKDNRYDRNYIRNLIVPLIKARYPKYLKFFAHLANFSSMIINVNVLSRSGPSNIFVYEHGAVLIGKHFSEIQIQEIIHNYSNADRGEIITPIQRMLKAIDNQKKGPFHFSGGIEAYYTAGMLMFYPQRQKNYDESIAKSLQLLTDEQLMHMPHYKKVELEHAFRNLLRTPDALMNLPGLVLVLESDSICRTLNTSVYDPLFPEVSAICKERGLRFLPFQKCIDTWTTKAEKLPKKLRLLPLSHLSNLFTSQE